MEVIGHQRQRNPVKDLPFTVVMHVMSLVLILPSLHGESYSCPYFGENIKVPKQIIFIT